MRPSNIFMSPSFKARCRLGFFTVVLVNFMLVYTAPPVQAQKVWCWYRIFNGQIQKWQAGVASCDQPPPGWQKMSPRLEAAQAWRCVCDYVKGAFGQVYAPDIVSGKVNCSALGSGPRQWQC